jgi:outer membrane protein assembly factor BamB
VGLVLIGTVLAAEDWPQWRGPGRDGQIAGFAAPETWPKELQKQWTLEVGLGHASPVVVGDKVFVLSRQGEDEVVRALTAADGKELWSAKYPAPYKVNMAAVRHGKGPKSTPAVADGRVFTLGISGILSGWDAGSGNLLWQHEFSGKFASTSPLYGTATSPMVEGNLVIAHVGGHNSGALTAFDAQSGEVKWQWDGDGPGYTSAILATLGGTRQIVTQSQAAQIGVGLDGKLLWQMPFKTPYDQNVITPVVAGELLIFSGLGKPTTAYRMETANGKPAPTPVWENKESSMYMSSPVVVGGRLVGMANRSKGQFFCLDAASGKTLWLSDGGMGDNAAILAAGELALALTSKGDLVVFKPGADAFAPLARWKLSEKPTWAHPTIVGKQILIKDEATLTSWTW